MFAPLPLKGCVFFCNRSVFCGLDCFWLNLVHFDLPFAVISELIHYTSAKSADDVSSQLPLIQVIVPRVMSLKGQLRDPSKVWIHWIIKKTSVAVHFPWILVHYWFASKVYVFLHSQTKEVADSLFLWVLPAHCI